VFELGCGNGEGPSCGLGDPVFDFLLETLDGHKIWNDEEEMEQAPSKPKAPVDEFKIGLEKEC
jgi:hypothetical protein